MKKVIALLLCIAILLTVSGCSMKGSPDTVVTEFCNHMKEFDFEAMMTCMLNPNTNSMSGTEYKQLTEELLWDYMVENAAKMKYQIVSSNVADNQGAVDVKFTYVDATPVVSSAVAEFMSQALLLAFSGADDAMLDAAFTNVLSEKTQNMEETLAETTITLKCEYTDDGWKIIEVNEDLLNVLTGNIISMGDLFEDDSEASDDTVTEEYIRQDVTLGTEVELSMIKVCVTDCCEALTITSEDESITAPDGTKFVVLSLTVENISKDTFDFDMSSYPFFDGKDRHFELYDDIMWYSFDDVHNKDLAPNMPVSGIVVYNVPLDAADYYFTIQKADTNEIYCFYGENQDSVLTEWPAVEEDPTVEEPSDVYALDYVNGTTGSVFDALGSRIIYADGFAGCAAFYYPSNPDMYFGFCPFDWDNIEATGDEPIALIWVTNSAKITSNLSADMTKAELDSVVWDTPDVQHISTDSFYSEVDGVTVFQYTIETSDSVIIYEWYLEWGNETDYPASWVYAYPING